MNTTATTTKINEAVTYAYSRGHDIATLWWTKGSLEAKQTAIRTYAQVTDNAINKEEYEEIISAWANMLNSQDPKTEKAAEVFFETLAALSKI